MFENIRFNILNKIRFDQEVAIQSHYIQQMFCRVWSGAYVEAKQP